MDKKQVEDLWPDEIKVPDLESPVVIVKKQASLLGKKTKNLVQAKVIPTEMHEEFKDSIKELYGDKGFFSYDFIFTIAGYGSYNYKLFEFRFGFSNYPVGFDPLEALAEELKKENPEFSFIAKSEDELRNILKAIFNAKYTKDIIKTLLAQVQ